MRSILAMSVAIVAMLIGCAQKPVRPDSLPIVDPDTAITSETFWPFWPTSMRIHPLTRVVGDPQSPPLVIEARLEFLDADGITTRAVGELTFQLYPGHSTPTGFGAMRTWNTDLRVPAFNRQYYDDITSTYLFRLELDPQELPEQGELRGFFLSNDGRQLEATLSLRR